MGANRTDLSHGRYVDEIEITVLESVPTPDGRLAYTVEDTSGDQRCLIVDESIDQECSPGEEYRIESVLGFDPDFDEREAFPAEFQAASDNQCPGCDGDLTFEADLKTPSPTVVEFLSDRDPEGISLVYTEHSRLFNISGGDDWRPLQSPAPPSAPNPHYRCTECTRTIPRDELEWYLERGKEAWQHTQTDFDEEVVHSMSESVGMATGGAKDVDNFRENISEGYLPEEDALTYEGLFYDYYFDTGDSGTESDALFYPSYSTAVTDHPLTDETEYFLTVGLNSSLSVDEFERRRLNLVAVLDVSGSMGSPFDQYYYDEHGTRHEIEDSSSKTKMEAATESLAALTTHLEPEDRFGVVLYNSRSHIAKPLSLVDDTDMGAIRGHIRDVQSGGGTNMSAGLESAIDLLAEYDSADPTAVENRIIFLTDMMPNTGSTGKNAISGTIESAATRGIYTTFVGMGIDANPELTESLSEIRGANHYFVHSAEEFEQRLDDEFEYMVTPLVFDLQLELDADVDIQAVYGSPNADRATGRLMHVSTLFPSPTEDGDTRGGVVVLQLDGEPSDDLALQASWEEIDGSVQSDTVAVSFHSTTPESFENTGIQKAVCLTRYCSVLRSWIRDVRNANEGDDWTPMRRNKTQRRGQWEHESMPLTVPDEFSSKFETLQSYLEQTSTAVEDQTLQQEIDLLEDLVSHDDPEAVDLDSEALDRLADIVDLAPTTNGELGEAWDMDSGSDVHAYLEAELEDLYERDENMKIQPTKRGRSLVARLN